MVADPGFRLFGEVQGVDAGEFWGSEEQVAIHYRRPGSPWGFVTEITACWDPNPARTLTGTNNGPAVPVNVNGRQATYHDGTWLPGSGPEQIDVVGGGKAHWGRELVHSLTMRTDRGVFAVRCPRDAVPGLSELVKIMASIDVA